MIAEPKICKETESVTTVKPLKIQTYEKFAVITIKLEQGFTIE